MQKRETIGKGFLKLTLLVEGESHGAEVRNGIRMSHAVIIMRFKDHIDYLYDICQASHPQTIYKRGFSMRSSLAFLSEEAENLRYLRTEQIAGQRDSHPS